MTEGLNDSKKNLKFNLLLILNPVLNRTFKVPKCQLIIIYFSRFLYLKNGIEMVFIPSTNYFIDIK